MQNLEGVAMSIKMNKKIKVIIGNFNLKDGPFDIFDKDIIKKALIKTRKQYKKKIYVS